MNMRESIETSLKAAMKSGDDDRKRVMRLLLAAAKLAEVEKGTQLDDVGMQTLIQKEIKIRHEAIEGAERANRPDLIAMNQREIVLLEKLLPKQLDEGQIADLVKNVVEEIGATGVGDTGKVMKALMPKIQGQAAGDKVSQIVRQILQSRS
jgi:uncharacterized protein YqeY